MQHAVSPVINGRDLARKYIFRTPFGNVMASVWLELALVLLATAGAVRGNGNCSTVREVQNQAFSCQMGNSDGVRNAMDNPLLFMLNHTCRFGAEFYDCMDAYTQNCSNRNFIMEEVEGRTIMCNGTRILDWVTDYIVPNFQTFTTCFRAIDFTPCYSIIREHAVSARVINDMSPEAMINMIRGLKASLLPCLKKALKEAASQHKCGQATWQDMYAVAMVTATASPGFPSFQFDENDWNELMDYVASKISLAV